MSPSCVVKIDLQKSYDSFEWNFLEGMLEELNFPRKFIGWLMECVISVKYSIIISGFLIQASNAAKGLS